MHKHIQTLDQKKWDHTIELVPELSGVQYQVYPCPGQAEAVDGFLD